MIDEQIIRLEQKIDLLLNNDLITSSKKYLTAKDVQHLTGLDHRTVLNRSNLNPDDPRFIPSIHFGSRRKYFERKVIERLFHLS